MTNVNLTFSPARLNFTARAGITVLILLSIPIAVAAMRYLLPSLPGAPRDVLANAFALPTLPIHAGMGAVALLVGPFQFLPRLRRFHTKLHRTIGVVYLVTCLVSGFAGLLLAFGSSSGIGATLGFGSVAIIWISSTMAGFITAMRRDFTAHRRWMVRSFALTFSAVTLRLMLPLDDVFGLPFQTWFVIISFLCWIPNLMVAELYLILTGPRPQNQPVSRSLA